jgi:predicted O-linked N-acetylglucosamine transferase (SPINDLY family)
MTSRRPQRAFSNASLKKMRKTRDVSATFAQALALHQSGSAGDAQILYKEILRIVPNHFDALHLLGVSECQIGKLDAAERLLRQALVINPRSAAAYSNLGNVLSQAKRLDEALTSFERAIELKVDFAEALFNRGNTLRELERFDEAVASYDRAIALRPDYAEALGNRGNALRALQRPTEALESCDKAIALKPNFAEAWNNRANALRELDRLDEALASYDRAIAVKPDFSAAYRNRGIVLHKLRRLDEALASYDRAAAIEPSFPDAFRGNVLFYLGRVDEAIASYDRALAIQPDHPDAMSHKIFALDFCETAGFAEHQAVRASWWQQIGAKIAPSQLRHDNDREPTRRIVLGYVSSDFKQHSAAFAFGPVLRNHDKERFQLICYSCSPTADAFTAEFQRTADTWRNASHWSDDRLAEQIRADRVDILIDLSGHSGGNRLLAFARKPAPVQVTAWGHATGTGLRTMDYLFSDPITTPTDVRHLFAEEIYDLPSPIIVDPPPSELRSAEPPVLSNGYLTYGCFNRVGKISDTAVGVWARILQANTDARLVIKDWAIDDQSVRRRLTDKFVGHGISADRVDLLGFSPRVEHLAAYARVDVCLDPFPQNGGICTWEALHMGVPVVAKLGNSVPSRASAAILSAIGMGDWVASSNDEYVDIALKHAALPHDLRTIRRDLPAKIASSAAGNPALYVRAVEKAYRTMWERYCAGQAGPVDPLRQAAVC